MTTQDLDNIYAAMLPPDVQRSLYARWDALSDEQRIALRHMDPAMIKPILGAAIAAEVGQHAIVPITNIVERAASLARNSRAYVQKLIWQ